MVRTLHFDCKNASSNLAAVANKERVERMTEDETGGYCPKCDTVWAVPGRCRCEPAKPIDDIVGMNKFDDFDRAKVGYDKMDAYDRNLWNAAIEAAALICYDGAVGYPVTAVLIRKLKK